MKMYYWLVFVCLGFFFCQQAKSQNLISGKVLDSSDHPLGFANVILLSEKDSVFVEGTMTKGDGLFQIKSILDQHYILKISSIGYKPYYMKCGVGELGKIFLQNDSVMLKTAEVVGARPKYQIANGALITNIENTLLRKTGTAEDILKHLPGIIEKNHEYIVFGKGVPIIYVDNRQIYDLSVLDNLKSEDIKCVELITNPGAKYDATVKAIIKIKTINHKNEGLSFEARSSYFQCQNANLSEQLDANFTHKNINIFSMLKYTRDAQLTRREIKQTVYVDTLWQQENYLKSVDKTNSYQTILGFSYMISKNHSIGVKYTGTFNPVIHNTSQLNSTINANDIFYDKWNDYENKTIRENPSTLLNAFYNGTFGKVGLDFSTNYLTNSTKSYSIVNEFSLEHDNRIVESMNYVKNNMLASKLVTTYPLLKGQLSIGGEFTKTKRDDNYLCKQNFVPTSYSGLKEQNISTFLEMTKMTVIGQISAGLRYEKVRFKYYEDGTYKENQSKYFNDLFPNFSLGTKLGNVQAQLSYTIKTKRPTYRQLSNNVYYVNRYTLQQGNPLLLPETIHDISLIGLWKCIQFTTSYQNEKNTIIYWAEQSKDNSAITTIAYNNLKKLRTLMSFISVSPKLGIWDSQLSLGVSKQWLNITSNNRLVHLNSPIWLCSFHNSLQMPLNYISAVDIEYQSKGDFQNISLSDHHFVVDISLSKTFFHDKLSVQLKGMDIFNGYMDGNLIYNKQMHLYDLNRYNSRKIGITFRYNFNSLKIKYKGNEAGSESIQRM